MPPLATWCKELTHLKRPWCWERLKAGGEGDSRGWDGWMASPTQWTWIWVNSRSWWWTGRPGVLQSMGLQRVGHDWATELNSTDWTEEKSGISCALERPLWVQEEMEARTEEELLGLHRGPGAGGVEGRDAQGRKQRCGREGGDEPRRAASWSRMRHQRPVLQV